MEATAEGGWWIIANTPDGIQMYQLKADHVGPIAAEWQQTPQGKNASTGQAVAHIAGLYAEAVRRELNFPPDDHWMDAPVWSLRISPGGDVGTEYQPHPKLLAKAVVHDELPAIDVTEAGDGRFSD